LGQQTTTSGETSIAQTAHAEHRSGRRELVLVLGGWRERAWLGGH
jgi:hypothetical protein